MAKFLFKVFLLLLGTGLTAGFCQASETNDNQQLLCAITKVIECDSQGKCVDLAVAEAGLPDFITIDLETKTLAEATPEGGRESSFSTSSSVEGQTILAGVDGLRGWSAVLSDHNRRLSASISDELAGFVVFGVCRAEP